MYLAFLFHVLHTNLKLVRDICKELLGNSITLRWILLRKISLKNIFLWVLKLLDFAWPFEGSSVEWPADWLTLQQAGDRMLNEVSQAESEGNFISPIIFICSPLSPLSLEAFPSDTQ